MQNMLYSGFLVPTLCVGTHPLNIIPSVVEGGVSSDMSVSDYVQADK